MDRPMEIPCGQCIGCRMEKAREWAVRCVHECSLHDGNSFITLTYDDDKLPDWGNLVKADFQNFVKRLRYRLEPKQIRYFASGEYGDDKGRPHFHSIIFGEDFSSDRYFWKKSKGENLYRSPTLEKAWTAGFATIGEATYESAQYIARYQMKRIRGPKAEEHYLRVDVATGEVFAVEPEFGLMSNRPGIGRGWLEKYKREVYENDSVILNGQEMLPPGYYDLIMGEEDAEKMESIKRKRQLRRSAQDETPDRLDVREHLAYQRLRRKERMLDAHG